MKRGTNTGRRWSLRPCIVTSPSHACMSPGGTTPSSKAAFEISSSCASDRRGGWGGPPGGATPPWVGPWQHVPWIPLNGIIDHGPTAENPIDDLQLRWFDHWLKGRPLNEVWSKVRYFLMGANCWNEARHWPPRAETCTLYLHSSGCAGSRQRDGRLLLE